MKNNFKASNFMMAVLVVFTMMYQSVHSVAHVFHEIESSTDSHGKSFEHRHVDSKHCFVCNFTFSPFTSVSIQTIRFFEPSTIFHAYTFSEQTSVPITESAQYLRGPPAIA